jgi:MFS family permease
MSLYVFISVGGGSLGLLAGGLLTSAISWHWIFFINVPIGLAALVAGRALIDNAPGLGLADGVDWLGAILVTAAGMLGVFTIIKAPERGWVSGATLITALGTLVLAALFVAHQRRRPDPIVPARVLRLRSLSGSSVVRGLFASGLFASFYVGTLYFQRVLGYGTVASGAAFLPQTLMVAAFAIGPTTRLVTRFGAHRVLVAGLASMSAGPRPCNTRAPTSSSTLGASPHSAEAATNTESPPSSTRLRPSRSPRRPATSRNEPKAIR